jgi:hypothetical protein
MMENYQEKFVAAEKEASELANDLKQLKKEIKKYKSAGDSLDVVSKQLSEAAAGIENLARSIENYVDILREFDIAQLTDKISESLEEQILTSAKLSTMLRYSLLANVLIVVLVLIIIF